MGTIRLTKADLARFSAANQKAAEVGGMKARKSKKAKTPAPPLPTHEPGTVDGVAQPYRENYDSKDEVEFAGYLEQQRLGGHIIEWSYKPVRLRIGDGVYYSPDFRVVWADKTITFYEIKGFMREAARVRIHAAAERHPHGFVMIRKRPRKSGGGWDTLYDSHSKRKGD